jgi:hypothetical protein
VRSNLDTPEHFASSWVDLYDAKFIIQRHTLRMGADIHFTGRVECHIVELAATLPLAEESSIEVKPLQPAVLTIELTGGQDGSGPRGGELALAG